MAQLPIDPARVASFLDMNLRTRTFGYAETVDKAAIKKSAPEMLETFESLREGKKKSLPVDTLRVKYLDVAKASLAPLAGKVPSEKELAALPPLVRAAVQGAEHRAIYNSRYTRALTDPFPDGVVDLDFVFKRNLAFIGMQSAEKLIVDLALGPAVEKLIHQKKGKKPTTLPSGLVVSVEKEPKHQGKPVMGLHGEGPFLVVTDGQNTVIADYEKGFERLETRAVAGSGSYAAPATTYEAKSIFERFGEKLPGQTVGGPSSSAEKTAQRFQHGFADLPSLGLLARGIDELAGGKKQKLIDETLTSATQAQNAVLGQLTVRDEWVDKYREIAKFVRKNGEQSIGDMDHTIAIGKRMERSSYGDDDVEKTEVLVKDQGPLLLFYEHAGEVSHAVRLDALKEGRLEMFIARDGYPASKVEIDAQGKMSAPNQPNPYFYSLSFDINLVLGTIRGEL